MKTAWVHPAHGRVHLPTRHQRTVAAMHRIANAPVKTAPDMTSEERLLLAIFGLRDGETVTQALANMRARADMVA